MLDVEVIKGQSVYLIKSAKCNYPGKHCRAVWVKSVVFSIKTIQIQGDLYYDTTEIDMKYSCAKIDISPLSSSVNEERLGFKYEWLYIKSV